MTNETQTTEEQGQFIPMPWNVGFHKRPTKYYMTNKRRNARRKMAKASRRANRGLGKGQTRTA